MGDRKTQQELDAARMRGDLPLEVDSSTGQMINPHIPDFMAKAPWYLQQQQQAAGGGLAHQKKSGEAPVDQSIAALEKFYVNRGQTVGKAATGFRKGACRNCGSATHAEKDCLDRPRKVGAWKSGSNIAADEVLAPNLALGFDAKRDRYAGYDANEHEMVTVSKFAALEEERKIVVKEAEEKAAAEAEMQRKLKLEMKAAKQAAKEAKKASRKEEKRVTKKAHKRSGEQSSSSSSSSSAAAAAAVASEAERGTHTETAEQQKTKASVAVVDEDASTASEAESSTSSSSSYSSSSSSSTTSDSEFDIGSEDEDLQRAKGLEGNNQTKKEGSKAKMSSWNVRLREDTAKYLLNLDTESAFYDPKTRAMRDNPFPGQEQGKDVVYAGDNAWKSSGMVAAMAQDQLFAWEASEKTGDDVHLQANPTQTALLKKQFEERKAAVAALKKQQLLNKYGNTNDDDVEEEEARGGGGKGNSSSNSSSSFMGAGGGGRANSRSSRSSALLPAELRMGVADVYVEYTRDGRIIKGPASSSSASSSASSSSSTAADPNDAATTTSTHSRSKSLLYAEDVYPGNHTSVWGSWFDTETKSWGFACCHSALYNSYCTGSVGKQAVEQARNMTSMPKPRSLTSSLPTSIPVSVIQARLQAERDGGVGDTGSGSNKRKREFDAEGGGREVEEEEETGGVFHKNRGEDDAVPLGYGESKNYED